MKRIPLADLDQDPFDVVVIGAGINGSGAVQHLAARGYRVLIVDKYDFSSGVPLVPQIARAVFCTVGCAILRPENQSGILSGIQDAFGWPATMPRNLWTPAVKLPRQ
jgi:hypothetical protein